MKKITKATKAPQRTLTQQDLAAVLGGTGGTIIVQNGVGETGKTGSG
jgi:hypothetical protein